MSTAEEYTLGQAIRDARLSRGWSQAKLARELEVPEETVRRWELGRNEPSWPLFLRLAGLFGWRLNFLRPRSVRGSQNSTVKGEAA